MIKEHYPQYADFKFNCAPGSTGDGIELGQKAGGAIECMGRDLGAFLSTTNQAGSNFEIAFLYPDHARHPRERVGQAVRQYHVG